MAKSGADGLEIQNSDECRMRNAESGIKRLV